MDPKAETPHAGPDAIPRKQLSRRSRVVGGLLAVLVLGGTGWLTWHLTHPASPAGTSAGGGPGGPGRRPSTTVGVATAERAHIPVVLDALGTVTPLASVKVTPRVSGVMQKVLFQEGQMVRAGDLLASIDPQPFELALRQASGERQRDEAQLDSARVTLKRYQTLWQQDSIARQDVDTQAALVKQLAATVASDRASEQAAQLNLDHTRIVAPITGRIGLRAVDAGNLVSSGGSTGIATIAQMDPIDVEFAVPQDRVPAVLEAQREGALPVTALDRARSQSVGEGVFSTLDNAIDTATGTVRAKARLRNPQGRLFPNQFVNVRLQLAKVNGVLVPVTAVRTGPQGDYVYVIDAQGVAHTRLVTRGLATVDQVLVAKGLEAGEQVVTEGGDRVKDGARVRLQAQAPADGASAARKPQAHGSAPRPGASSATPAAALEQRESPARPAQSATENTAGSGVGPGSARTGAAGAPAGGAPVAPPGGSSGSAGRGSNGFGAWLESLPPAERDKIMAMQPEERRAYVRQLREQRQGSGAAPAN